MIGAYNHVKDDGRSSWPVGNYSQIIKKENEE